MEPERDDKWIPEDPWEIAIWVQDEPWDYETDMPDFGPDVYVWIQCNSQAEAEYVRNLIDKQDRDEDGNYIFTGIRASSFYQELREVGI